jgi:hypothetical protein
MLSFEQEIKAYLKAQHLEYKDNSSSFKRLDFSVVLDANWTFYFDAKEKRQQYNLQNWNLAAEQEEHTFILDDLAARKILAYAPWSGMVVRDNLRGGYFFYSVLDLFLMPKTRTNRPIHKEVKAFKGKWVIDLRNGVRCASMTEVFAVIRKYIAHREEFFLTQPDCFGDYMGEGIGLSGEVRKPAYWEIDVKETR